MSDRPRSEDLSTLAWVQEELRRSLDAAHKALRRFVRDREAAATSDLDAIDPAVLRGARTQIHQGVGALELIGQTAAARVLAASETLVQRFIARPEKATTAAVDELERASFALLDYLARLLAGRPTSPLSLFPRYRAVLEAANAERVHPADLWDGDWSWRRLPEDPGAQPRAADATVQSAFEGELLALMRAVDPKPVAARLGDLCAALGAGAEDAAAATLWRLAAAVYEAQAAGLIEVDVFGKRIASRLLAHLRAVVRGEADVPERLAQDLLFFCAQAAEPPTPATAPRLAGVREVYALDRHVPVDYAAATLGRVDPAALALAKKRVGAAKDAWSGVAGGELHRLGGLSEQFALVGESLRRLFPEGERLATELQHAVVRTRQSAAPPEPALAMEVATVLLYVEAALEDADVDHPEQSGRIARLADRLAAVGAGHPSEPLEAWMEELYRRVSDRQTMGSVVQELRAALTETETTIDRYFREPAKREWLIPVPNQLAAMRGVLSVLGMEQASAALLRMRDEVDQLASTEVDPAHAAERGGAFDRLAGNLGALGFLIDMLAVQPQMAKSLFAFDAASGSLRPLMGREAATLPAPAPADAATAVSPVDPVLIEQAQWLAFNSARDDVPSEALVRDLDRLSQDARAADQPGLAATAERAQRALADASGTTPARTAAVRDALSEALVDFVASTAQPAGLDPAPHDGEGLERDPAVADGGFDLDLDPGAWSGQSSAGALPSDPGGASWSASGIAPLGPDDAQASDVDDDEMLEVFLEEAREVLADAGEALDTLHAAPDDTGALTTLRRAFHTLKGSSRMVGLAAFGEGAWVCEQVYNAQLAAQTAAAPPLLDFTARSLDELGGWVDQIARRVDVTHDAARIEAAARAADLLDGAAPTSATSAAAKPAGALAPTASAAPALAATVPFELPTAAELDLGGSFDFTLDLDALTPAPAPIPAPAPSPAEVAPLDFSSLGIPSFDPAPATSVDERPVDEPPRTTPPTDDGMPVFDAFGDQSTEPLPLPVATEAKAEDWPGDDRLDLAFDLDGPTGDTVDAADTGMRPLEAEPASGRLSEPAEDAIRVVGPLRIGAALYNIYLNEADELSRRLSAELIDWARETHRPVGETPIALAHSLAGNSATVGFQDLSQLARALEQSLTRSQAIGHGTPEEGRLFVDAADEITGLLHQFAAGFLRQPSAALTERLAEHDRASARRVDEVSPEPADLALELETVGAEGSPAAAAAAVDLPLDLDLDLDQGADLPLDFEPVSVVVADAAAVEPSKVEPATADATAADDEAGPAPSAPAPVPEANVEPLGVVALKPLAELAAEPARPAAASDAIDTEDALDAVDAVDAELFPIFTDEAVELLPQLAARLRDWMRRPADAAAPAACMRTLHTLKGGARLAGAMRLGEMAHRLETRIEHLLAAPPVTARDVEALLTRSDALAETFEALQHGGAAGVAPVVGPIDEPATASRPDPVPSTPGETPEPSVPATPTTATATATPSGAPDAHPATPTEMTARSDTDPSRSTPSRRPATADTPIDWSRFLQAPADAAPSTPAPAAERAAPIQSAVRVRAPLLDRLVNQAGEVSISRSRIEGGVGQIKASLADLTDNLERLRAQLRDIEFQGETQMSSRLEAAKAASQAFDPLEFDRFTRFQELTRMMAESVNDVATVQRSLQRSVEVAEDELAAQARLTRDLQDGLLRTRMIEFEGLSDRLYRVVRQTAKETGKSVRLDIVGGGVEVDRGVLDRMTGSFEHLLRNAVAHGIERSDARAAAGKEPTGTIVVALSHAGNEVGVEFRDDGGGLDLARIRDRGERLGLLPKDRDATDTDLANLIFEPGFSTAETVTEYAGRGVGMDVVRSEVQAMGGRIETATTPGQGTSFRLILPLTTAVTQVVMVRCGTTTVALPSTLVESVRRVTPEEADAAAAAGTFPVGDRSVPFFHLGALLQTAGDDADADAAAQRSVVVVYSAQQRIAVEVDEVLGNQEVVVKHLGPQLSRLPGLAGVSLLASGDVALIYNPVALATLHGESVRAAARGQRSDESTPGSRPGRATAAPAPADEAPLVMVVDDSLTVRRVTQRLLQREGYRVLLAKDGLDAIEQLATARPEVLLSDIEMPRMDGFDLVRHLRAQPAFRDLPVIMITSRIAQKHREYALELGVDHYLGKPYSEEDLLALIARHTARVAV